ncbi:MAG TPA: c-type cytochrome, partial [Terriglobia bacterium]
MLGIPTFTICAALLMQVDGRTDYLARCVGCHGADGTGGGHGPAIVDVPRPRAISKAAVLELIRNGILDRGMPAFQISDEEASAIADYVMFLKSPPKTPALVASSGNAAAGERFFHKNSCGGCHMLRGSGGVLGPDLSNVGRERTLAQIEQALRDPGATGQSSGRGRRRGGPSYPAVTVHLRDGRTIQGIAKNESNFDLQLLGADEKLYLLSKDQISEILHDKSLMPKVEATSDEIRDLIAYLNAATAAGASKLGAGVSFAEVAHPKRGTWPTYDGNQSGNRFSPLDQI